jgi:hypothetical protein
MTTWTSEELDRIGGAEELEIAPLRRDETLRKPVTVWVVRVGDGLYVRSGYGRGAAWYRGVQVRHEGRIEAAGLGRNVTFTNVDPADNDKIDAAYRAKYSRHGLQYVASVVTTEARSTTIRLVPR